VEGFIILVICRALYAARGRGDGALAGWVQAGKLKYKIDVLQGLEHAPATLRRLFEGRNEGKQLLRVAE
jgi:NADPH-dependent curcumin reductase